ncbi:hypothetical protein IGI04_038915 [Brassica rapa subsp. trilocularis]|uniref:Uncharacterized protein n=1 Tax=Brassica rapa subsp. trilocularis TaxID=1813537 RepID=A0ABQ7LPB4_BRACM|nr:hypothetical protein IGI04_038915 [Brassica rapa subsp. trilocularis]
MSLNRVYLLSALSYDMSISCGTRKLATRAYYFQSLKLLIFQNSRSFNLSLGAGCLKLLIFQNSRSFNLSLGAGWLEVARR